MTMATSNFINKGKFFFELVFQSLIVYFFYLDDDKKASINLDESNVKRKFSQRYKDRQTTKKKEEPSLNDLYY